MNPQSSGVEALVLLGPGVGRSARRLPGPSLVASDALASSMPGLPVEVDFPGPDAGRRMSPAPPVEAPLPAIPQDVVRAAEKNGYEAGFAQGEARRATDNILLGHLSVPVPRGPAGQQTIEVRFTYDVPGSRASRPHPSPGSPWCCSD